MPAMPPLREAPELESFLRMPSIPPAFWNICTPFAAARANAI